MRLVIKTEIYRARKRDKDGNIIRDEDGCSILADGLEAATEAELLPVHGSNYSLSVEDWNKHDRLNAFDEEGNAFYLLETETLIALAPAVAKFIRSFVAEHGKPLISQETYDKKEKES